MRLLCTMHLESILRGCNRSLVSPTQRPNGRAEMLVERSTSSSGPARLREGSARPASRSGPAMTSVRPATGQNRAGLTPRRVPVLFTSPTPAKWRSLVLGVTFHAHCMFHRHRRAPTLAQTRFRAAETAHQSRLRHSWTGTGLIG